jgi:membrane protease YdiL (CAAX protease family)
VAASMMVLFAVPPRYFIAATFGSTAVMVAAAVALGALRPAAVKPRRVAAGAASAAALYVLFLVGGAAIDAFHPLGVTSASESSIYALIASPSNPLSVQVGALLCDAAGYESFFRGVLQRRLAPSLGAWAAPAVALFDAALHVATLNPVWVGATFVTDVVWGLTYHYGRGTQASFASHFLWDLAIFVVRPVT